MPSVNKVILIGNLGRDPEKRSTTSGLVVANLSIGTSYSTTNQQTRERTEVTEWSRVVLFGKTAEFATQYARKGNLVYVEGRLQTRKWEDSRTGQDRYMTEIVGREFRLLERRSNDADSANRVEYTDSAGGQAESSPPSSSVTVSDDPIDDIPW